MRTGNFPEYSSVQDMKIYENISCGKNERSRDEGRLCPAHRALCRTAQRLSKMIELRSLQNHSGKEKNATSCRSAAAQQNSSRCVRRLHFGRAGRERRRRKQTVSSASVASPVLDGHETSAVQEASLQKGHKRSALFPLYVFKTYQVDRSQNETDTSLIDCVDDAGHKNKEGSSMQRKEAGKKAKICENQASR